MPSGTSGGRFVGLVEDLALGQNTVCVGDFIHVPANIELPTGKSTMQMLLYGHQMTAGSFHL